jgi:DNA-binding NtrC family response regulator
MKKYPATILIVDDDEHVLFTCRMILKDYFEHVETLADPKTLESFLRNRNVDVVLLDMNFKAGVTSGNEGLFWMSRVQVISPRTQVVLQTAYADIALAVKSIKEGAVDFLAKPWDKENLVSAATAAWKLAVNRKEDLAAKGESLGKAFFPERDIVMGCSDSMRRVWETVSHVAPTEANVLLLGENGTGKEVVAAMIHHMSKRAQGPFASVDLGAIPSTLFESEMFGHEKGAFTDARDARAGKFEQANKGTLFLDEIGNLPVGQQVKLLSVLESRTVTRLGSAKATPFDVRIICATNARLPNLVQAGLFRADLYYRIKTVELVLPPLRG